MVSLGDVKVGEVTRGKQLYFSNEKPEIQGQKLNELFSVTHCASVKSHKQNQVPLTPQPAFNAKHKEVRVSWGKKGI